MSAPALYRYDNVLRGDATEGSYIPVDVRHLRWCTVHDSKYRGAVATVWEFCERRGMLLALDESAEACDFSAVLLVNEVIE